MKVIEAKLVFETEWYSSLTTPHETDERGG